MDDNQTGDIHQLATDGLELWEAGELLQSEDRFRKAIALADRSADLMLPELHGQLASVLSALSRNDEALEHYRYAVSKALEQDRTEGTPSVNVARYFLAEHLLRLDCPSDALQAIEPTVKVEGRQQSLAKMIAAEAYWKLGQSVRARHEAKEAVTICKSEEQRRRIVDRLSEILGKPDAG